MYVCIYIVCDLCTPKGHTNAHLYVCMYECVLYVYQYMCICMLCEYETGQMFEYVYLVITFEKNKATPVIFKQTSFEGLACFPCSLDGLEFLTNNCKGKDLKRPSKVSI